MLVFNLSFAGFYGKSDLNTCETPQPPASGSLEIRLDFDARKSDADYYLTLRFNSAAEKVSICNFDRSGDPERNFSIDAPLSYHTHFSNVMTTIGTSLVVVVGSHENGYIEFIFKPA